MYDIVFLSYHEPNADARWELLKDRFPRAMRISDVDGLVFAHHSAAEVCKTRYFWVVDADNLICSSFDFSFKWDRQDHIRDRVAVWKAENSVNGLTYGYGGVKLLPRRAVLRVSTSVTDFTTSISNYFHVMDEVASITVINDSPYDAWRAGFRECVKLASGVIRESNSEENLDRLMHWQTYTQPVPNRAYVLMGAVAGDQYGTDHANDPMALGMINDWGWLRNKFERDMEHMDDGSESCITRA